MNERIQQLAITASGLATDEAVHLERVHNRAYTEAEWQDIYSQKFAQLIVEECANWGCKGWSDQLADGHSDCSRNARYHGG